MTEGGVDFSFECVGNSGVLRNAFLSVHEVYSFPFYNTITATKSHGRNVITITLHVTREQHAMTSSSSTGNDKMFKYTTHLLEIFGD